MKAVLIGTGLLAMFAVTEPAVAECACSSSELSNPRGDRGGNFGGAYTDAMTRAIGRLNQGGDAHPRSGGVGDSTGHTAQMNDKAR